MKTEPKKSRINDISDVGPERFAPFGIPADTVDVGDGTEGLEPVSEDNAVTASLNAEVMDEAETMVDDSPAPIGNPRLANWLTAKTLFNSARTVVMDDPARLSLGLFYEAKLKYESEILVPYPIPSSFTRGILNALRFRRKNPRIFVCQAIDVVLTAYLHKNTRGNDERK